MAHRSWTLRRRLARRTVARRLRLDVRSLSVRTRDRVPDLYSGGSRVVHALSLSHHGRFAAFACLLEEPVRGAREAAA